MDEILIEKVREHEFLYNHGSSDYRDQHIRQSAWEEIGRELKIPANKAKERWDNLRRCFCNARSRRRVETKSGMAAKKKSPWKYEELMSFIIPYLDTRKTQSNLNDSQTSANLPTKADVSDEYETQEEEEIITTDPLLKPNPGIDIENERNSHINQVAEDQSTIINTETNKPLHETGTAFQRKNLKRPTDSPSLQIVKILKQNSDLRQLRHEQKSMTSSNKTSVLETLDDTDLFFLSMSRMTKKLPKTEQAQIKLALSNSVLTAEIRANDQQSFFSSPSPASVYSNGGAEYASTSTESQRPTIIEQSLFLTPSPASVYANEGAEYASTSTESQRPTIIEMMSGNQYQVSFSIYTFLYTLLIKSFKTFTNILLVSTYLKQTANLSSVLMALRN